MTDGKRRGNKESNVETKNYNLLIRLLIKKIKPMNQVKE